MSRGGWFCVYLPQNCRETIFLFTKSFIKLHPLEFDLICLLKYDSVMDELLRYIKSAIDKGQTRQEISDKLKTTGWSEEKIALAFSSIDENIPLPPTPSLESASVSVKQEESSGNVSMWDSFEHILLFISLYSMGTSIALILHALIDQWILDSAINQYDYYGTEWRADSLRLYLAFLIVSYPIFAYMFNRVSKKTDIEPALRRLKSRKILIYITLIVTFLLYMTSIGQTIYKLLSGSLTANFMAHALTTIILTGIVFYYYLQQVKDDRRAASTIK